jgi:hypothetical protein
VKPSVTIDERGVTLHIVTEKGEGIAVPLETDTLLEIVAAVERGRAVLKTPAGRSTLFRGLGKLLLDLTDKGKKA